MTARQLENLIKIGTVQEVDPVSNRIRVQHGGLLTDWLKYKTPAAGGVSIWRLPSIGEACLILSPSGETENGTVLCGIDSTQYPAPSQNPNETVVRFPDGAEINYDHVQRHLKISGIQTADITAEKSATVHTKHLTIDSPVTDIEGALNVKGLLTYQGGMSGSGGEGGAAAVINGTIRQQSGSIISNGINLTTHTHTGDSGGTTGQPQ